MSRLTSKKTIADFVEIAELAGSITLKLKVSSDRAWPASLRESALPLAKIAERLSQEVKDPIEASVCLCSAVGFCTLRLGAQDFPDCPANVLGICAEATKREGPVTFRVIGALVGRTYQRAEQIVKEAMAKLRRSMMADPMLAEACANFGIGRSASLRKELEHEFRSMTA